MCRLWLNLALCWLGDLVDFNKEMLLIKFKWATEVAYSQNELKDPNFQISSCRYTDLLQSKFVEARQIVNSTIKFPFIPGKSLSLTFYKRENLSAYTSDEKLFKCDLTKIYSDDILCYKANKKMSMPHVQNNKLQCHHVNSWRLYRDYIEW